MKKLFTFLFVLIAGAGIASSATSGTCGDNLTWELSDDGVLTISGTGDMHNYGWTYWGAWVESPWYSNRNSIHTVIINDGATSIGEVAFYGCSSLTSVTIGNSVTTIVDYAFSDCSSLTSVTIPNSVTSIGGSAFYRCYGLTSVTLTAASEEDFCKGQGNYLLYDAEVDCERKIQINGTEVTDFTIPNSVTTIGDYAFRNCSSLTSITIPNSVTTIGKYTFEGCSSLTSINVDAYNSKYSSADGVLFNKDKTTLIAYPRGKQGAYTIPNSVTSIGNRAFSVCSSLTSITIPNSVTSIGNSAFSSCSKLTSVTINSDAIVNKVYTYSSNLSNIFGSQVTKYIIGDNVKGIGEYAFYCSSLTSVTIPNSVTRIEKYAFRGCSKLTSVTIPNSVTRIGDYAFDNCSGLTSVTINSDAIVNKDYSPDNLGNLENLESIFGSQVTEYIIGPTVKGIGEYAFYGCSGLTSVTIGNSVTNIGEYAFSRCSGLTSVSIGNSVTSIEYRAFYNCSSLTSVHISDIAAWCQIYFYNLSSNPLCYAKNLYLNGELVTNLVIPNSVTSIGGLAFGGYSSLTSVTIPNSVTTIGNYAFYNCSSVISVTIGNSVTSIGEEAFYGCNKLYDVYCYATTPPTAHQSSFANYNAFLHVPCDNQRMYLLDVVFGNFKYVECIGAEEVMTDGVTVVPGKNDAVFTWPTEGSANSYTLEIKKDGMVFCTLTFNANGQLTGIAFMPRPDSSTPAKAATSVGAGYQFTVTGLDGASHYTYKLTTKDAANQVIASYTGEFSTEGFTALEDAVIPSLRVVDGAVVCDEPYTIYDISGRDVTNQNGTLQGVYIVRTAKGAVKVVF